MIWCQDAADEVLRAEGALRMTIPFDMCQEGVGVKTRAAFGLRVWASAGTLLAPQGRGGIDASGATAGDRTGDERHQKQH
jgi:hypothetical protein